MIGRWRRLRPERGHAERATRWVVVDTETTGLDPERDELLSLAAVAVVEGEIVLGDRFEREVYSQRPVEADNVLIHGIGAAQRAAGAPLRAVLEDWERYRGEAPLLAFHAAFDQRVLQVAARRAGLRPRPALWLDLAELAAAVEPRATRRLSGLDDWLRHYGIPPRGRHQAGGDVYATAQVLLRLHALAGRPAHFGGLRACLRRAATRRVTGL